jgi:hypothetical protein
MLKELTMTTVALALALFGPGRAVAGTILDLENPPLQSDTPYDLSFVAGATSTEITVAGYQVPSFEFVTDITLTSGGENLLGQTWDLIPAPCGSYTQQYDDGYGTGTNGIEFEGTCEGSLDQYYQSVTTVPGQTYNLSFLYSNAVYYGRLFGAAPSALVISASDATSATPEPPSVVCLGLGLYAGFLVRRRLTC